MASILKIGWLVLSDHSSLWSTWMRSRYLNGESYWTCDIPKRCSSVWRSIWKVRDSLRGAVKYELGNGRSFDFWRDPWMNGEIPIISWTNKRGFTDMNSWPKVANFRENGVWVLPPAIDEDMESFLNRIIGTYCRGLEGDGKDRICWIGGTDDDFVYANAWEIIRSKSQEIPWHKIVWAKPMPLSISFLWWWVMWGRIATLDKVSPPLEIQD